MNRADLITVASEKSGITKVTLEKSLEAILSTISAELACEGTIKLAGFGLFETVKIAEKSGTNPKTREPITIPACTKVRFKPFKDLKDAINK